MEDYAAKMALKPDAALREYVASYAQYQEAAVLAALDELRRRGQPAPEEATLRPLLEPVVQQAKAAAVAQAATEVSDAELPRLYSPTGIVVMSMVVSVVVGGIMLAINMYQRKRGTAIIGLAALVGVYFVGSRFLQHWLLAHHLLLPIAALINLPLIVAYVWWFWPRYVGTYQFQPRSWVLPLFICLLGFVLFLLRNPAILEQARQQMEQQMSK